LSETKDLAADLKNTLRQQAENNVKNVDKKYRQRYLDDFESGVLVEFVAADDKINLIKKPYLIVSIFSDRFDAHPFNTMTAYKGVEVVYRRSPNS
jgi:hypothetical protein